MLLCEAGNKSVNRIVYKSHRIKMTLPYKDLILGLPMRLHIAGMISLTFLFTGFVGAASLKDDQNKRCSVTKENLRKAAKASFEGLIAYDPGKDVYLDPKDCKHEPIACEDDGKDSIVTFPLTCGLLHHAPNTPKDNTSTGEKHSFKIRVRVTPEGKTTVLK